MDSPGNNILGLIRDALELLDREPRKVAAVARKAIRIARINRNAVATFSFEYDFYDNAVPNQEVHLLSDLRRHHGDEKAQKIYTGVVNQYNAERKYQEANPKDWSFTDAYVCRPLDQVEYDLDFLDRHVRNHSGPPDSTYAVFQHRLYGYQAVISRVRNRVFTYLSKLEQQYVVGEINATIFDSYRSQVDSLLGKIAPDVLNKFNAVYERIKHGDKEALSQALSSCRRILNEVANIVYPPSDEEVLCVDNKKRVLNEAQYVNRIYQFVSEAEAGKKEREVLRAQVDGVAQRFEALNGLANKGTHAEVSLDEANQCAIQTYLVAGDILRLHAHRQSALPQLETS